MEGDNEIIIYQGEDGLTHIDVKLTNQTVWLSQQQMAELYQTTRTNIVHHIKNIYDEGELEERATCQYFSQVRQEGNRQVSREIPFYNLDNILSSTGQALLNGPGSVSHQEAMEKAEEEYRKFQVREFSPVERAYLDTIKALNAKAKKKGKD